MKPGIYLVDIHNYLLTIVLYTLTTTVFPPSIIFIAVQQKLINTIHIACMHGSRWGLYHDHSFNSCVCTSTIAVSVSSPTSFKLYTLILMLGRGELSYRYKQRSTASLSYVSIPLTPLFRFDASDLAVGYS